MVPFITLVHPTTCTTAAVRLSAAIAESVREWQSLKEQGKLEGEEEEEEEDIYAEARMLDVSLYQNLDSFCALPVYHAS